MADKSNENVTVRAVFSPRETELMVMCIEASIEGMKRSMAKTKNPKFLPIYEQDLSDARALLAKVKGVSYDG